VKKTSFETVNAMLQAADYLSRWKSDSAEMLITSLLWQESLSPQNYGDYPTDSDGIVWSTSQYGTFGVFFAALIRFGDRKLYLTASSEERIKRLIAEVLEHCSNPSEQSASKFQMELDASSGFINVKFRKGYRI
jgi:hypothetical protein